ncbi:MAG: response regulator [Patescibacteria group bacterium]|nr:response regulator [Patescibacteria group bacterium]
MPEEQNIPVPPAPPASEPIHENPPAGPARSVPLVLVADDDNNFREVVATKLKAAGFEVIAVKDGAEALAKTKDLKPNLALLDINMPLGPSGTETALEIKGNPDTAGVKTLFLSGQDDPFPGMSGDKPDVSHELGAEDFIMKTESLDAIVEKVRRVLGTSS